ncbi:MAG: TrmH family RNA methyltransferase [Mariniblastus sp.]
MIEKISSLQNPRVKKATKLHTSRGRQLQNRMIVFGEREVNRAIDAGIEFEEIFVPENASASVIQSVLERCASFSVAVFELSPDVFGKISYGDRNDGLIGVAARPKTELSSLNIEQNALVVVAQAIEKPGNVGAIVRTADACGVSAILLADPLTDFYHPNSIRSSTAAVFGMQVAVGSSEKIQHWLKENQFNVFTAMLQDSSDFYQTDLRGNTAVVLGNEARGLSDAWSGPEFKAVKLPMLGSADSLNVSVTASVMLYEASRQRNQWSPKN